MIVRSPHAPARGQTLHALTATPPRWLATELRDTPPHLVEPDDAGPATVSVRRLPDLSFVEVEVPQATSLDAERLQDCVARVYLRIAQVLAQERRHPVRFWSYVPDIHAAMGGALDRYLAFNAGRYRAFTSWYGTPRRFDHTLATASALGVEGDTLSVHCLAADAPGTPIENPRQVPSYRYSTRFGPRPPCFARATRPAGTIAGRRLLLVGGTASIVGEESHHAGDVARQTRETLVNLQALLAAADRSDAGDDQAARRASSRFTDLRVYVVGPDDALEVLNLLTDALPHVEHIEMARAKICRRELLVEIEGIATG